MSPTYLEQMILAWQWLLDLWGLEAAGQRSPQSQPEGLSTASPPDTILLSLLEEVLLLE